MSNRKTLTREVILNRAVELFNERGIEAVGMRDLARDLGLSPGNLTYHYARKEDLILGVAQALSALNSATIELSRQPQDLGEFLEMFRALFANQYPYRCLVLAVVHVMERYPAVAAQYRQTQTVRVASFRDTLLHLRAEGSLRADIPDETVDLVAAHCSLIGRFWLSESWLRDKREPQGDVIDHYLRLLASVLLPHVTQRGEAELAPYLTQ